MVNQNIQETPKKFQDNKTKEYEKRQKQINETLRALNKHQTEKKITISREINELGQKLAILRSNPILKKEKIRKRMKQKYKTKWKAIPAEQNKQDRISELEDEMVIKGKTEELLVKQLKTCEKKMHELTDSIKRPNLIIMGIEEDEKLQAKGMSI
jgi:hypothetical protein